MTKLRTSSEARNNRTVRNVFELGSKIGAQYPTKLQDLYRDTSKTLEDIATTLFPALPKNKVDFYTKAVGQAIRVVMDPVEREALTRERRSTNLKVRIAADPKAHKAISQKGGQERAKMGCVGLDKALIARGIEPWKPGERELIMSIIHDPTFQHTKPNIKGKPDWNKIATHINNIFHGGKSVREGRKLRGVMSSHRYDKTNRAN